MFHIYPIFLCVCTFQCLSRLNIRKLSAIRFYRVQDDALCGGCCWYCYSEVLTRAVIPESASHCNALGNLSYFDCSFSHTQMCCGRINARLEEMIGYRSMHVKHSAHSNVLCSAWSRVCGRNNRNGTLFRWLLLIGGVLFSHLPSNDLDAILTPCTIRCWVSISIFDRY